MASCHSEQPANHFPSTSNCSSEPFFYEDPQVPAQSFQNSVYTEVDSSYGAYQNYNYSAVQEHLQYPNQNWNSVTSHQHHVYQVRNENLKKIKSILTLAGKVINLLSTSIFLKNAERSEAKSAKLRFA